MNTASFVPNLPNDESKPITKHDALTASISRLEGINFKILTPQKIAECYTSYYTYNIISYSIYCLLSTLCTVDVCTFWLVIYRCPLSYQ
jgi:hypothetical protein